ncbi:MAG: glycosyltransferase family 39 protein [Candidatus Brocadiia bacterium]
MTPSETAPATSTESPQPHAPTRARRLGAALAMAGILLCFAFAYVDSITPTFLINPDSAIYMGLGRSLARGDGYTFNATPYGKYPPTFPVILAGVYLVAGQSVWGMQLAVALCGLGALLATYGLVRPRAGVVPALTIAVLTGACSWFVSHAVLLVRADVPYAFFSLAALWYAERQLRSSRFSVLRWVLAGLLGAVAVLTHMVGTSLVIGLVVGALLARRAAGRTVRQRLVAAALVGLLCGGATGLWMLRVWSVGKYASYRTLVSAATRRTHEVPLYRLRLRLREWVTTPLGLEYHEMPWAVAAGAFALLVLPGLVDGLVRRRGCAEFYLAAFFVISTCFGGEGGHERYVVPIVPLLLYFGYESLGVLGRGLGAVFGARTEGVEAPRPGCLARAVMVLAVVGILGSAVYTRVRYTRGAEALAPDERQGHAEEHRAFQAMADYIRQHVPEDAVLYGSSGGATSVYYYYLDRPIIRPTPGEMGLRALRRLRDSDVDYVVSEVLTMKGEDRIDSMLALCRQCLEHVHGESGCDLWRVNQRAVRRTLAEHDDGA